MPFSTLRLRPIGALVVLLLARPLFAFRSGPLPAVNGSTASVGATCVSCHTPSGPAGIGAVQIIGAPSLYAPNHGYDLTVRIADPDQLGAGFQISAEDAVGNHLGSFTITDSVNTKHNDDDPNWVNHTSDGVNNAVANWGSLGNAAEYHIRWQSPAANAGPVTFFAAGNAINNNFGRTGDHIYTTNVTASFDPLSVPTLGEWGLVVLGLSLLSAAAVVIVKRGA